MTSTIDVTAIKSSRKSILLVGLSEAGKTALFTQLSNQSYVDTVTSMKENEEQISVRGGRKLITLVDVPGFDRLRNQSWERFKDRSLGIIFVIDSVTFLSNLHNVADLLYQYLSDDSITAKRIPFLIACTKQDETRAKTAKVIATQLEKEFNTIRETRIGALDTISEDDNTRRILGNENREFQFSDLRNNIKFIDCNASKESPNYDSILKWIDSIA
ncbi:hypothetical protein RDWZM_008902 [Blomia tropicalis]|uniref:ADP-ribosylation factor-related protein 1 n=1 Tax=Blomia tropicalis TaxID=40697 RepID=A0A9Q0M5H7_BLOTA|nr:hypothetical protein RDWZM_008902 [Blomia tropicalis]